MNTIWKLISLASFGLLINQIFFEKSVDAPSYIEEIRTEEIGPFVSICEEMPRFPGCEYTGLSKKERQSCADKKMLEFVYSNIKYPRSFSCIKVQGLSVAQFTIRKDGSLSDIKIVKSLSSKLDDEILKMLKTMPRWIPGKQRGREVSVRYNLPIKFHLE